MNEEKFPDGSYCIVGRSVSDDDLIKIVSECVRLNIGMFGEDQATTIRLAKAFVIYNNGPVVVKKDGLCAGKGVIVAHSMEEAVVAIDELFGEGVWLE